MLLVGSHEKTYAIRECEMGNRQKLQSTTEAGKATKPVDRREVTDKSKMIIIFF